MHCYTHVCACCRVWHALFHAYVCAMDCDMHEYFTYTVSTSTLEDRSLTLFNACVCVQCTGRLILCCKLMCVCLNIQT
jgi:hypothetical protein